MSRLVISVLLFNYFGVSSPTGHRDVKTEGGVIRGYLASDGDYIAYLGVPYAAPPIGENRFKDPQPQAPWNGIYEANRVVECPQNGEGDEDCLILNVFTPINTPNDTLPVVIYIHGGSFLIGRGQTKGVEPLIKQGLIVVTINYRLGALGFLCLRVKDAPGNAGLKDQVAAFLWVKHNIANFNGDANNVTIYGMSAGGASVEYHVLSKMSEGLFQKAIVESASATAVWAVDADPIATAMTIANILGFPQTQNVSELIDYYKETPADILTKTTYEYYLNITDGPFGFEPCLERELSTIPFITEAPYEILTKQKYKKVPMMFFFATLEGLFLRSSEYYEQNYREKMATNFGDFVPADLIFDNQKIRNSIADKIKHFYFGEKSIDNIIQYLKFSGDTLVLHGLLNSVEIHSKNNTVYLLDFAYKGDMGSYEKFYEDIDVAGHGDVVKHAILNKPIRSEADKLAVSRVSTLIGNFVKFGNPTPQRTQLFPVLWPKVDPTNFSFLRMNRNFLVLDKPYWNRKVFWDNIYARFRKNITLDSSLEAKEYDYFYDI